MPGGGPGAGCGAGLADGPRGSAGCQAQSRRRHRPARLAGPPAGAGAPRQLCASLAGASGVLAGARRRARHRTAACRRPPQVFEASSPVRKYSPADRAACWVVKFFEYSLAGIACGFVGQVGVRVWAGGWVMSWVGGRTTAGALLAAQAQRQLAACAAQRGRAGRGWPVPLQPRLHSPAGHRSSPGPVQGLANGMMQLKRKHMGESEHDVPIPPVVDTALVWGLFMGARWGGGWGGCGGGVGGWVVCVGWVGGGGGTREAAAACARAAATDCAWLAPVGSAPCAGACSTAYCTDFHCCIYDPGLPRAGVSSNTRYQIVAGLERLVDMTIARKVPAGEHCVRLAGRRGCARPGTAALPVGSRRKQLPRATRPACPPAHPAHWAPRPPPQPPTLQHCSCASTTTLWAERTSLTWRGTLASSEAAQSSLRAAGGLAIWA